VINANASDLMGRQETQHLIDEFKQSHPAVIEELIPDVVPVGRLQRVLQNLLTERVPVRDFRTILETLADYSDIKDVEILTEYSRTSLRRSICNVLLKEAPEEGISVLTIAGPIEELIKESVQSTPAGLAVAMPPEVATRIFRNLSSLIDQMIANGQQPVVLAAPHIRLAFRKLTASSFPTLYVVSYNEIAPEVEVSAVGVIRLENDEDQEIHSAERAVGAPASA
jgi:flagellar biosynthesis protein FlhA